MEKPKTEEADGTKEEPAKGRRRKSRPAEAAAPDPSGKTETAAEEMDPIMATIEAVLAKAAAMDTSAFKKARRTKKQQQGDAQKQDGEKSTADDLDNDDDSSTAGNRRGRAEG